jgi:hypothetical protein
VFFIQKKEEEIIKYKIQTIWKDALTFFVNRLRLSGTNQLWIGHKKIKSKEISQIRKTEWIVWNSIDSF